MKQWMWLIVMAGIGFVGAVGFVIRPGVMSLASGDSIGWVLVVVGAAMAVGSLGLAWRALNQWDAERGGPL